MSTDSVADREFAPYVRACSRAASAVVIVVGAAVLAGWIFDISFLKGVLPGFVTMKANTGVAFILAGISLGLLSYDHAGLKGRQIAFVCALVAALIGGLSLAEYISGWDLGIDQLLFKERSMTAGTSDPGRMAPATTVNFLMVGAALMLLHLRRGFGVAQWLTVFAWFNAFFGATVNAFVPAAILYHATPFTLMAVHTSVAFLVLSMGIVCSRTDRGLGLILASRELTGTVARWLMAVALLPFLIGLARQHGIRWGLYGQEFGFAIGVMINTVILSLVAWRCVRTIDRVDSARKMAAGALSKRADEFQQANELLGAQVTVRQQAEEKLRVTNRELEATNGELEAFSYSVSHDLRAPLRSIDGFSQALLEDCADKLDEQGKDDLRRVCAASQRMGHLIDAMLTLSRVTRGRMNRDAVDLSEQAQSIARDLVESDPGRDVEFVIEPGLCANADPALAKQALDNLLRNAWKFTGKRDRVKIEFGRTKHEGRDAYFVRDNGAGFDMRY